jgi:hypothetical protein
MRNTRAVPIYLFRDLATKDFCFTLAIIGNENDMQKRERETNHAANKYLCMITARSKEVEVIVA